jgi:hypothetical protein
LISGPSSQNFDAQTHAQTHRLRLFINSIDLKIDDDNKQGFFFFFFQFWGCSQTGDQSQEDLAIFGYRPAMKLETFMNASNVLATC